MYALSLHYVGVLYVFVVVKINKIPSNEYVHFLFILSNHDLSESVS